MPQASAGKNITSSAQLNTDVVTADAIAANAVGTSEVDDDTLVAADIAANAIGASELADNAVDQAAIGDDAVGMPELKAGIQGDVLIYGASGTPALLAAGTSGDALTSGGAGANPSWVAPSKGFAELDSDVTTGSVASLTSNITAKQDLLIYIHKPDDGTTNDLKIRFNADSGTNYFWSFSEGNAAAVTGTDDTDAQLCTADTSNQNYFVIHIHNDTADFKLFTWRGIRMGPTAGIPTPVEGAGVWKNTAAQITSITILGDNNLPTGTRMTVYGGDN